MLKEEMLCIFDAETSTKNKGHPFDPDNFLVSYSIKYEGTNYFKYYTDPDFISFIDDIISKCTTLVGFNIKFDVHWLFRYGITLRESCKVFDCSLAEFILSGQKDGFISLNESLERYGLPTKKDQVAEYWSQGISTEDIPLPIVEEYNKWDVETTEMLYNVQKEILTEKQLNLVYLEGEDLKALAHAEQAGIKYDSEKAMARMEEFRQDVANIESSLLTYLPVLPNSIKFNFDSGDQLSALLYGGTIAYDWSIPETKVYKSGPHEGEEYTRCRWFVEKVEFPKMFIPLEGTEVKKTQGLPNTATHFYQVDEPTLRQLKTRRREDKALLELLFQRAKKIKVVEMVESINKKILEKNWQDGCIHPSYNQNIVITGRLSSSGPNMQNTPPEIDKFLVSRYG